ncbi:MAG: asparagine synthase (glutamine-hydrolyzing) [Ginsengibacter sp.]
MCGITGFCDFKKHLSKESLSKSNYSLKHRGPDNGKEEIYQHPNATIGFGHRRLSILDLSECGSQPMHSDDGNLSIILNGEIYNFNEIKKDLEKLGYAFQSTSDTEVIIKAYEQWGIEAVQQFIGMFVFVLLDREKNSLYIFRDRAGVKPLYYYHNDDCILFASELKALHHYPVFKKEINETAVSLFFKYAYIPAPHTIFKNTFKLQAGHYLEIDLDKKTVNEIKYYDIIDFYNKPKLKISEQDALEETERLLTSAFQYRMVSDVRVGVFLSGGYDSTAVAAILQKNNQQKIKTFTIGFEEEEYNEAGHAKKIAEYIGTDHHEYYCTIKEAQDIFPELADIYDEPFGDSSAIPTTLVSRFARKNVKVALSADGGDEVFAGYNRYDQLATIHKLRNKSPQFLWNFAGAVLSQISFSQIPVKNKMFQQISKLPEIFSAKNEIDISDALSQHFSNAQLKNILNKPVAHGRLYYALQQINDENDFLNTVLALDYKTYMADDILVKVDRATMSVGLEGREPLLDHRIIEFVSQLPSELKYKKGIKKYLLKEITHKYVPKELLNRPKTGFGIPVYEWLRNDLKEQLYFYISEEQLSKHNYLNIQEALRMRDDFIAGKKGYEVKIWLILIFQIWWNRWM